MMKNRIDTLVSDKQLAAKLLETVMKSYEQIKIAQQDFKMIKDN